MACVPDRRGPEWAIFVLAAIVVLLVAPSGTVEAHVAVPVGANHAGPISRGLVVTDAQHAALVIHAGARPFIVKPASAGVMPPNMRSSDSATLGDLANAAITDITLAGLGAGALLIWRARTLQARNGEGGMG